MSASSPIAWTDAVVVGAGVIGLAVAAELARRGLEVLVLERHAGAGRETSSRNSGVVHAGLYYPPGSRKARLCVRGNALLYELCRADGVDHARVGKLVVATDVAQLSDLEALAKRADENGAAELTLIDGAEAKRRQPGLCAVGALASASTGIVDAHGVVKALEARLGAHDGFVCYRHEVVGIELSGDALLVEVETPEGSRQRLRTGRLVNAAGLESDRVARMAGDRRYELHWCRGDYFSVPRSAARDIDKLLYPLPSAHGLGIHATVDLAGRVLLGPDTTYVPREPEQPDVDPEKASRFREAAARYLPQLARAHLQPDSWGLRPKLQAEGEGIRDFEIESHPDAPGLVQLVGIESPGLTAALAIAEYVAALYIDAGVL